MTQEEQRIEIAKACGWTVKQRGRNAVLYRRGKFVRSFFWPHKSKPSLASMAITPYLPDYFGDLNEMNEAEQTLTDDEYVTFNNLLYEMLENEQNGIYPTRGISASAKDRALIFLKAKKKYIP